MKKIVIFYHSHLLSKSLKNCEFYLKRNQGGDGGIISSNRKKRRSHRFRNF